MVHVVSRALCVPLKLIEIHASWPGGRHSKSLNKEKEVERRLFLELIQLMSSTWYDSCPQKKSYLISLYIKEMLVNLF